MDKITYDATQDENLENRVQTTLNRDDKNKITNYEFKILVRDKDDFVGSLDRSEMEKIYRLYSSEGSNLTQRVVSREFPRYTFQEFKKIIRAFNITKASGPFPPHMLEERTTEELVELNIENKEADFLKKYEQDRSKLNEKKYKDLIIEHDKLKRNYIDAQYLKDITIPNFDIVRTEETDEDGVKVMIYLSDMHIGAYVSDEEIYDNAYDEKEVERRLSIILNRISKINNISDIVVFNLGDAIDGYNAKTTRPSSNHILPQNMSNKKQGEVFIRQMTGFFKYILENIPNYNTHFISVGHSNHGGDYEHSIVTALSILLETMGVETYVSTKSIDHFTVVNGDKEEHFIFSHGKDNLHQFKGLPLTLDVKTENYLNEYILHHELKGKITVVKGDLHQSATTYGKLFKYKSVGSLFGSSGWIMSNFGNTKWCCDFTVIDNNTHLDGIITE